MENIVLQTTALTKQYAHCKAVDNVDMTITKGDIYGFIGQNGAGKTTLLRMVTSLIAPTAGEIALFGQSGAKELEAGRKRIGCIVEGPAFFPTLTAQQNLEYYRIQRGIPDKGAIDKVLTTVNLTDTGKKQYRQFSLGMKQRLGLALAIMGKPEFLILDEPINGLDPMGIVEFRSIIVNLAKEHGMTILVSSHILSELAQVATRYGIIHNGQLVKEFTQTQLEEETKRCLAVKVNDAAAAAVVLEQKLNTTNFEVLPGNELRVYDYLDKPSEITFQLSTNGVYVNSISEMGTNLEEYFLQTIGQKTEGGRGA